MHCSMSVTAPSHDLKGARTLYASSNPLVAVVEPAQDRTRPHLADRGWAARGGKRRLKCQTAVRPLGGVVGHVLRKHAAQVPLFGQC